MTKEEIIKLAKQCMFTFNDDEIVYVQKNFEILNQQIEILDMIDTSDIQEMIYPFEKPQTYLREDIAQKQLTQAQVLQNAMEKTDEYIKVNTKVVQ